MHTFAKGNRTSPTFGRQPSLDTRDSCAEEGGIPKAIEPNNSANLMTKEVGQSEVRKHVESIDVWYPSGRVDGASEIQMRPPSLRCFRVVKLLNLNVDE